MARIMSAPRYIAALLKESTLNLLRCSLAVALFAARSACSMKPPRTFTGGHADHFDLGSRARPTREPDGSTVLHLGPRAPAGREGNWPATPPGKGYFAILRLYSPTQTAIDKSWKPVDIEITR
jgi:hypothetical protein